jgi:hypothetical protein
MFHEDAATACQARQYLLKTWPKTIKKDLRSPLLQPWRRRILAAIE